MKCSALGFLTALVLVAPAVRAQDVPSTLPTASDSDEIIVQALRIPREKLPTGVYWNYTTSLDTRIRRENAGLFIRCALRSTDTDWVRKVVDGEPNSATARFAQGWILQTHRGCYPPSRNTGNVAPNVSAGAIDFGASHLDRGIIVESVLQTYAPDAALTSDITRDTTIRDRFVAREGLRNRLRFADDRNALRFASCLVEEQPALATRLVRSAPGSPLERGLIQTIIVEGRACVGNTSRVTIDPSLTRVYIVDAFYRWVVAARSVDSLIPVSDRG